MFCFNKKFLSYQKKKKIQFSSFIDYIDLMKFRLYTPCMHEVSSLFNKISYSPLESIQLSLNSIKDQLYGSYQLIRVCNLYSFLPFSIKFLITYNRKCEEGQSK
jgi:hypothetical protein